MDHIEEWIACANAASARKESSVTIEVAPGIGREAARCEVCGEGARPDQAPWYWWTDEALMKGDEWKEWDEFGVALEVRVEQVVRFLDRV
jgi:hypothetical protein